ncbi:hypothetical protein F8M41_008655 [Gigaspora margarita]|uniref:Uncharacterized protein n=1 Tax=Gigaspora margarita TaxID=4874 RepID=A0A8H3X366_GIGMA|nr:hypothetical protein F8M41_008655 [Gigaspora margarita]
MENIQDGKSNDDETELKIINSIKTLHETLDLFEKPYNLSQQREWLKNIESSFKPIQKMVDDIKNLKQAKELGINETITFFIGNKFKIHKYSISCYGI